MARPLLAGLAGTEGPDKGGASWISQGTARAFAAAISALLIATFVVNRSQQALTVEGTATASEISAGTIKLSDDDNGQSLFDLADMVPGRSSQECISIVYEGTISPVALGLKADATGDLPPFLDVTIESGRNGGFRSCSGFTAERVVYEGTLAELAERELVPLSELHNTGDSKAYRVTFAIQDTAEALGRVASVGFVWEVKPS